MSDPTREALIYALRELRINANRLCDRNQGGTYEEDCRRSIDRADAVLSALSPPVEAPHEWVKVGRAKSSHLECKYCGVSWLGELQGKACPKRDSPSAREADIEARERAAAQRQHERDDLLNVIDALRAYVRHEPMCSHGRPWTAGRPLHHCTCGLQDFLDEAASLPSPPPGGEQ